MVIIAVLFATLLALAIAVIPITAIMASEPLPY